MVSKNFTDTPEEWQLWRAMSPRAAYEVRDKGLWSPSEALRFRDGLRVKLAMPTYGFQDLICFICLLQSIPHHRGLSGQRLVIQGNTTSQADLRHGVAEPEAWRSQADLRHGVAEPEAQRPA